MSPDRAADSFAKGLLMRLDVLGGLTTVEGPSELFEYLAKDGQLSGGIRK